MNSVGLRRQRIQQGNHLNGKKSLLHDYSYGLAFFTGTVTPSFGGVFSVSRNARMSASSCSFSSTPRGGMGEIVRLSNPLASFALGCVKLSTVLVLCARRAVSYRMGGASVSMP